MAQTTIPDRASNAGPEQDEPMDWRDYIDVARDAARRAARTEQSEPDARFREERRNRARIRHIEEAIAALQEARELLCR